MSPIHDIFRLTAKSFLDSQNFDGLVCPYEEKISLVGFHMIIAGICRGRLMNFNTRSIWYLQPNRSIKDRETDVL